VTLSGAKALANSAEELLELLSSLGLSMTIGSLYSIEALGMVSSGARD